MENANPVLQEISLIPSPRNVEIVESTKYFPMANVCVLLGLD